MAGGRDSVCERVNVIHASSVVYAYVRSPACARALSLPVNNLCVCVCVCACVCAEVCSGDRAREKEKCYRFLAQPCWRKICLGGTVITSLSPPPSLFLPCLSLSHSLPLSLLTLSLSIHVASIYLFNVAAVSIVRPKQSV